MVNKTWAGLNTRITLLLKGGIYSCLLSFTFTIINAAFRIRRSDCRPGYLVAIVLEIVLKLTTLLVSDDRKHRKRGKDYKVQKTSRG